MYNKNQEYYFHSQVVETLAISERKKSMTMASHQLMLTTRLMLLLEYLMKHLYDAPQTLLQQVTRVLCILYDI